LSEQDNDYKLNEKQNKKPGKRLSKQPYKLNTKRSRINRKGRTWQQQCGN
jgi:hypothetical protein